MSKIDLIEPKTADDYKELLRQMGILKKLSSDELYALETCTSQVQFSNKIRAFVNKYL